MEALSSTDDAAIATTRWPPPLLALHLCHPYWRPPHQLVDAAAFLLEVGKLPAGELALLRHLDRQRIDPAIVDQHLVVQMRTGRESGVADEADHLPLPHLHALAHALGEAAHVRIGRLVAVGVADADIVAVLA